MLRRAWVVVRRGRVAVPGSVLAVLAVVTACSGSHATHPVSSGPRTSSITLPRCANADATAATRDGLPGITLACLGKGPDVDVAHLAGPAVVNLWASWCYPCRQEMPLLGRESEELGGKVRIVGVDTNDQAAQAIAFAEDTARAGYEEFSDPTGRLAVSLHALGLPFTVAIDRGGSVVWRKAGQLTSADIGQAVRAAQAGG
ncbi:MAG: TlpA family protein disulfide reductase [Streptosporangiaceae bacterium]